MTRAAGGVKDSRTLRRHKLAPNEMELRAWRGVMDALGEQALLNVADDSKQFIVVGDASAGYYGFHVVQMCEPWDKSRALETHRFSLVHVHSGRFKGAQLGWTAGCREMWPLVAALEECPGYFYRAQPTVLVTDHASLVAVAENDFEKLTAAGLARRLRWRLKVQEANVTVWPIPGVANWLADALSRPDVVEDTLAALTEMSLTGPSKLGFLFPTLEELRSIKYDGPGVGFEEKNGVWVSSTGALYIPDAGLLRERVVAMAHMGVGGHRGVDAMMETLTRKGVGWAGMRESCALFKQGCIVCMACDVTKTAYPMGHTLIVDKPRLAMGMDFKEMVRSKAGNTALLVMMDLCSMHVQLTAHEDFTSMAATKGLVRCLSRNGPFEVLVSDGGPHFTARLVSTLRGLLGFQHQFTTPYMPNTNGTVESMVGKVSKVVNHLLVEWQMAPTEWDVHLEVVEMILNTTVYPSGNGRSAVDNHFGTTTERATPLIKLDGDKLVELNVDMKANAKWRIEWIEGAMAVWKALKDKREKVAEVNQLRKAFGRKFAEFAVGDYVMVTVARGRGKSEHRVIGPAIVRCLITAWKIEIEYLLQPGKLHEVHAVWLHPLGDDSLQVTDELRKFAEYLAERYYDVDAILSLRRNATSKAIEAEVTWVGYGGSTWEPIVRLHEDVPQMVEDALDETPKTFNKAAKALVPEARKLLRL